MSNGKDITIFLIADLIKRPYKMSQYFPKLCKSHGGHIKVELDLSNYATKTN